MNHTNLAVLTLDVGGTNLVFSFVENGRISDNSLLLPTASKNLEDFLKKLISGFENLQKKSEGKASAISFSFPGPADYESGIIGNLENLPFFDEEVPLAKVLENRFKIPVFINNDGDLFALGEARHGLLPEINIQSQKKYCNLLGITLGTGFGGGIVANGRLFRGDNSAAAEINRMSNCLNRTQSVEEVLSIRGIQHLFVKEAGILFKKCPEPFDIYRIAIGEIAGNNTAARKAWKTFGEVLGETLANAVTLTDTCVVIGGGLSGAWPVFLQYTVNRMNSHLLRIDGGKVKRMEVFAYNWENNDCRNNFLKLETKKINVPFSNETISYFLHKKISVGISKLGTSAAVALGAFAYAKNRLIVQ